MGLRLMDFKTGKDKYLQKKAELGYLSYVLLREEDIQERSVLDFVKRVDKGKDTLLVYVLKVNDDFYYTIRFKVDNIEKLKIRDLFDELRKLEISDFESLKYKFAII